MKNWKATVASLALAGVVAVPAVQVMAQDTESAMKRGPGVKMMRMSEDGGERFAMRGHKPGHHFERMAEKLELTEGQKAQIKADREAGSEARKARFAETRELHKQLREAVASGADQATLDNLGAQLGRLQVAKAQQMHAQRQQFEAILTDDQKARLQELKAERKEQWKGKRVIKRRQGGDR